MSASAFDLGRLGPEVQGTRFAGLVEHFALVESTNDLALAAAAGGARAGVWVADAQTAGRGRGGHSWHSAPGDGLYASLLVTPRLPLAMAPRLIPMSAGVAVRQAVLEGTGLELDLRWPNDLMFGELKCGGILVEAGGGAGLGEVREMLRFAVIGIGLNLNHPGFPAELAQVATSLYLESSREFEREPVLGAILRQVDVELEALEREYASGRGETALESRFRAASSWYAGKRVRVGADEAGRGGYTGWTRGLTPEGFMQVEGDDGQMHVVHSGGLRAAR